MALFMNSLDSSKKIVTQMVSVDAFKKLAHLYP